MEKRVMTDSKRRRGLMVASAVLGGVMVLAGCSGDGDSGKGDGGKSAQDQVDQAAAKEVSKARIAIEPKNGSKNGSINNSKVSVVDGTLTEVKMVTSEGKPVEGKIAADGKSWTPAKPLKRSTSYKVTATAKDDKGLTVHENGSFTTVSPGNSFIGTFTPEDGSTVGVGMPVSINFNKPIKDRKAVQSGITVTSTGGQEIVGHWFNSQRLDFRPEQYWKEGSTVTLKLALDGVEGAPGVTGVQQKTVTFKVGRNQVSTVDAKSKQMVIQRNGKTIRTIPISAGAAATPTYNGQMVISEKFKETRMNGATVGFGGEYDIPDVPHAMRLSTSGTFIHGNYWGSDSVFGGQNTSHGCVGLNDKKGANDPNQPGAWFYDNSLIGDVVIVKNSKDETIKPDNGLNGWNMDWAAWKQGSAL
ncbi:Ig-like domain-containing protein [Streptomyces sp. NPDC020875]|uniref:L,D-transpeptidase n=1 Tax=Streptomyces sp. NPDC020875 TaxID=3154898 RepID=UPI0033F8A4D8